MGREWSRKAVAVIGRAAALAGAGWRVVWPVLRQVLGAIFSVVLALILLFEEWGWRPLVELLSLLARYRPWARAEAWIAGLPPYAAVAVFLLPSALLLPLKFAAVYLVAHGKVVLAGLLFVFAKVAGTAVVARIFLLTRPQLMQIAWFARAYNAFMPWKEALFARVRESWIWRTGRAFRARALRDARRGWRRLRPQLEAAKARVEPIIRRAIARARDRLRQAWRRLRERIASADERTGRFASASPPGNRPAHKQP